VLFSPTALVRMPDSSITPIGCSSSDEAQTSWVNIKNPTYSQAVGRGRGFVVTAITAYAQVRPKR